MEGNTKLFLVVVFLMTATSWIGLSIFERLKPSRSQRVVGAMLDSFRADQDKRDEQARAESETFLYGSIPIPTMTQHLHYKSMTQHSNYSTMTNLPPDTNRVESLEGANGIILDDTGDTGNLYFETNSIGMSGFANITNYLVFDTNSADILLMDHQRADTIVFTGTEAKPLHIVIEGAEVRVSYGNNHDTDCPCYSD